jgi:hypothetical protein
MYRSTIAVQSGAKAASSESASEMQLLRSNAAPPKQWAEADSGSRIQPQ